MRTKQEEAIHLVLHSGLREARFKNSRLYIVNSTKKKTGAIFGFRTKEAMRNSCGFVITSEEAVNDNDGQLTHWTPNIYRYGAYTDDKRRFVKGHSEDNLRQINTLIVDIDNKEHQLGDILVAAFDGGLLPTIVIDTPQGYQLYYVLDKAVGVTKGLNSVRVAKQISKNLRSFFAMQGFMVDQGCNHLGICRIPQANNILYFNAETVYSFNWLIQWSMKQTDNHTAGFNSKVKFVENYAGPRQVDEPWFDLLLHEGQIKGEKGVLGRNNCILTLALACYSAGFIYESCLGNMAEFNARLNEPIKDNELKKICKSAYSGRYQAASRQYIRTLVHEWVNADLADNQLFLGIRGYYHLKKPRSQRQRSHYFEREVDIIKYLQTKTSITQPFLKIRRRDFFSDLNLASSTYYTLKKRLQGRVSFQTLNNGMLMVALISVVVVSIMNKRKKDKESYLTYLASIIELSTEELIQIVAIAQKPLYSPTKQLTLSVVNEP